MSVVIYDFDKTIYDGDSSVDFYFYCLKKKPRIIRFLPKQCWHAVLYLFGIESKTKFKGHFFEYLRAVESVEAMVESFWDSNFRKVKDWYIEKDHQNDVIISASPRFLLEPTAKKLGVQSLIATEMSSKTGVISGENCYGEEKVRRFQAQFKNVTVEEAYTDSKSDLPIQSLAKKKFLVKGHAVRLID